MSVLHTIRARAETACSAFWPHHRELPPPWVHAVHVARSTENNSASCSCGSWRGGGCEPRATLIYWSMQLKHYVSCSVKTFHVFLFFVCVCVFAITATAFQSSLSLIGARWSPPALIEAVFFEFIEHTNVHRVVSECSTLCTSAK
jgi:hypothetical protein